MWIAHLSDLHLTADDQPLYGRVDTRSAFCQALERIAGLERQPDLLLLTGDLANGADGGAYRFLQQQLIQFGLPFCLLPGNHDGREAMTEVFPGAFAGWQERVGYLDLPEGRLLLLDTSVPGKEWGSVAEDEVARLEVLLQGPALLAMHHPPFTVGIPGMDRIACRGAVAHLGQRLAGRVEGLFCGHVHRHVSTGFYGIPAQVAPSPAHQIALDAGPLAYTLEPGGFLLHDWEPGRSLISHYLPVQPAPVYCYGE